MMEINEDVRRIAVDEYLQKQIEFQEERKAEAEQELKKAVVKMSEEKIYQPTQTWSDILQDACDKIVFLRELQLRERNGL